MTDVRVEGTDEYVAAARRFADAVGSARFMHRPRVETADRVAAAARVEAPARTGALARSIGPRDEGGDVTVVVQAAHGGPVHAGRGPGRRGGRMAPNPFLDRALAKAEGRYVAALADELDEIITRAF